MTLTELRAANDRIASLLRVGRQREALVDAERLLAAIEREVDAPTGGVALQLQVLASVQLASQDPAAVASLERALQLRASQLGDDHPAVAATFRELAVAEHQFGRFKQATGHYRRAVAIWQDKLSPDHPFLARAVQELATLCESEKGHQPVAEALAAYKRGHQAQIALDYPAAQQSFEEAVELNRRGLGNDHPDVGSCLRALGLLHKDAEEYAHAIPPLREALYIQTRYKTAQPESFALALVDLASVLIKLNQFTEALELFGTALPIVEARPASQFSALARSHYGNLLRELARYDDAEMAFRSSISDLRSLVPPPDDLDANLAIVHSNLASLASERGRHAEAVQFHQAALDLKARAFGTSHPSYARTLLNMAATYSNAGDHRRAMNVSDEALSILRAAPHTDAELGNTLLLVAKQVTSEARRRALCDEALAIFEALPAIEPAALEERRIEIGRLRGDLTLLEGAQRLAEQRARILPQGHFKAVDADLSYAAVLIAHELNEDKPPSADRLHEARRYLERAGGGDLEGSGSAEQVAFYLGQTALVAAILESPEAGIERARRAVTWTERSTAQLFLIASERQRLDHAADMARTISVYLSIFAGLAAHTQDDVDDAATVVLNNKLITIDLAARPREPDADEEPRLTRLRSLKARIAERLIIGVGINAQAMEQEIVTLVDERDRLESELALLNLSLSEELPSISVAQISTALAPEEALLDFVAFDDFRGAWTPERSGERRSYAVFIHRTDRPVVYVDLGPAAAIDRDVARFVEAVGRPTSTPGIDPVREVLSARLSRRLLTPLLGHLERCEHLYVAADADLWALPYDALSVRSGELVIDRFTLSYLSSPRDLLQPAYAGEQNASVVVADPDFDLDDPGGRRLDDVLVEGMEMSEELIESGGAVVIRHAEGLGRDRELPLYSALPGTRKEALAIAAYVDALPVTGTAVTKQFMAQLHRPTIFHFASHGFFLEPGGWDRINSARLAAASTFSFAETTAHIDRMISQLRDMVDDQGEGQSGQAAQDPMALSGLVLAGANTWLRRGAPAEGAGDGHFTAHDVAALDLRGTRLVVLSCCDSARATSHSHAGVFGLRRAFVLAGAQDLVLSLWRVSDDHTAGLMVAFYKLLAQGLAPTVALRRAKLSVRAVHPDPYFWAAFTCQVGTAVDFKQAKERPRP